MSDYLPSFIVEPVLRQARRFSRLSGGEESPGFLPAVPDFQRWYPTRLWNTSPPLPVDEEETAKESTYQSLARTIQLWTNQLNNLDLEQILSPVLEPVDEMSLNQIPASHHQTPTATEFPPLEPPAQVPSRTISLHASPHNSDTSLNPARDLPYRSRILEDASRSRSQSDPLASSRPTHLTESTHVEPQPSIQETSNENARRREGSVSLPEDDGMGPLRQKISAVWAGPGTAAEKSRLVHALMTERYRSSRQSIAAPKPRNTSITGSERVGSPMSVVSGASQEHVYNLTAEDLVPTHAPRDLDESNDDIEGSDQPHLGCVHYRRNVKLQCASCEHWYTCRLCHDDVEDHTLPRRDTKHMLCMLCNTPQPASQVCKMCNVQAACYYCAICKLWNNDPRKSIYHCDDCGICRLGEGLGKDFFHCKTCAACMSIQAESTHRCIERSTKCDCPICGEYMFTSNKPVAFMRCGHSIHESCFSEWCNTSYKCPICSKSIANMESQFRRLDRHIDEQPMPEEYRNTRAYIFCNDCNSRSVTAYHWLGLKCGLCDSYNTTQLELLGADNPLRPQQQRERSQEFGVGEAGMTASQSHTPTEELVSPAASMLQMTQINSTIERSPSVTSPWLLPYSPSSRSARSPSPVVGSYFGTGTRVEMPRRGTTPMDDDDNLDFWGRQSPPIQNNEDEVAVEDSEGEEESSSDEDNPMDDEADDDDDEDAMDIFGHR